MKVVIVVGLPLILMIIGTVGYRWAKAGLGKNPST